MIIILFCILIILIFILNNGYEKLSTNVYTFTPQVRESTCSDIAQMWWQPVSYILNP